MAIDTNTSWKTTLIISASPKCDEASQILLAQHHRIRRSDSILSSSFVSPLSGTAFLLLTPEEFPAKLENAEFLERIEKFVQVHRNSFLLLQAPVYGKREWEILSSVQNRFLGRNLRVIPVHSTADVVKGILVIAKATSKPSVVNLRDQMSLACTHIIDRSPVWGMLRGMEF
ncbi:protein SPO16 homolog isoform X1 [Puntigrus tetrazona]|uniref:protein SPO16 homolog isoform X1 n=1 Tax=Puntigrus tetrazona TaxID=1606681 RepID=UPI001C890713|nr:protein SPO16 homolog isoform X1 [Puntigrus tetrazona]